MEHGGTPADQDFLFGRPLPEPQLRGWPEAAPAATDDDARPGTVAS